MTSSGFASLAFVFFAASASAQKSERPVRTEVPAEQRAPKGMCRIWLKDVAAAQQPAPTDCAAAVKNCPPNGKVIFGDTEETKSKPKVDAPDSDSTRRSTPMIKSLIGKPVLRKKPPE